MNLRQLRLAVALAETRSFSQLAEKLNISQPALSKQIQALENGIGMKLFDRNTLPLSLTPAGAYFVEEAREILYRQDQLLRTIERFKTGEAGRLVIGVSPFRNLYLMPRIVKAVKDRYPGVQVVLHESNSTQLRKDAAEGKYDFVILNLPVDDSILDYIPMEPEQLILAVPRQLLSRLPDIAGNPGATLDFSDCANLPFVVLGRGQEMRQAFDRLCAMTDMHPHIAAEIAGGVTAAWAMAGAGVGATLLPRQFVRSENFDDNLVLFTLKNKEIFRQPAVVIRRGQYVSEYAQYAVSLLTQTGEP